MTKIEAQMEKDLGFRIKHKYLIRRGDNCRIPATDAEIALWEYVLEHLKKPTINE